MVPYIGYYGKQLEELIETVKKSGAEVVVSGTPLSMANILETDIPVIDIDYKFVERKGSLKAVLDEFMK